MSVGETKEGLGIVRNSFKLLEINAGLAKRILYFIGVPVRKTLMAVEEGWVSPVQEELDGINGRVNQARQDTASSMDILRSTLDPDSQNPNVQQALAAGSFAEQALMGQIEVEGVNLPLVMAEVNGNLSLIQAHLNAVQERAAGMADRIDNTRAGLGEVAMTADRAVKSVKLYMNDL